MNTPNLSHGDLLWEFTSTPFATKDFRGHFLNVNPAFCKTQAH